MYNPYGQSMPYMPAYQQPQQPTVNVNWVYVNGIEGARAQIVQPGQTSWMMDNNMPVIYVKSVDGMGTAALKAFRLEEMEQDQMLHQDAVQGLEARIAALEAMVGGKT